MKITIDETKKEVTLNETVSLDKLVKFLEKAFPNTYKEFEIIPSQVQVQNLDWSRCYPQQPNIQCPGYGDITYITEF